MKKEYFIFKIWMSTILIPPIPILTIFEFSNVDPLDLYSIIEVLILMVFCGFIFSIPTMFLLAVSTSKLVKFEVGKFFSLFTLSLLTIFGIFSTFYFLGIESFDFSRSFTYPAVYSLIALTAIFYNK